MNIIVSSGALAKLLSSLVVNEEQGTAIGTEDKQTIFADGKQVIFI